MVIGRTTSAVDQAFEALADPTRRRIFELLAERARIAGEIASEFDISQPAISRHLRVLRDAGLVSSSRDGQRRLYRLEPDSLRELEDWVERRRRDWERHLDALEKHLATRPRGRTKGARK